MIKEGFYESKGKRIEYKKGGRLPDGFEPVKSSTGEVIYDNNTGSMYTYAKGGRIDYDADIEAHKARDAKSGSKKQQRYNARQEKIDNAGERSDKVSRMERRNRNLDRRTEENLSANYNDMVAPPEPKGNASYQSSGEVDQDRVQQLKEQGYTVKDENVQGQSGKNYNTTDPAEAEEQDRRDAEAQKALIVTDYDRRWDYKKEGDKIFAKKKTSDNWIRTRTGSNPDLEIRKRVFGESIDQESTPWSAPVKKPVEQPVENTEAATESNTEAQAAAVKNQAEATAQESQEVIEAAQAAQTAQTDSIPPVQMDTTKSQTPQIDSIPPVQADTSRNGIPQIDTSRNQVPQYDTSRNQVPQIDTSRNGMAQVDTSRNQMAQMDTSFNQIDSIPPADSIPPIDLEALERPEQIKSTIQWKKDVYNNANYIFNEIVKEQMNTSPSVAIPDSILKQEAQWIRDSIAELMVEQGMDSTQAKDTVLQELRYNYNL